MVQQVHDYFTYPWQEETLSYQKGYEWTKTFMASDLMK